jgi:hypothetical protein
VLLLDSAARVVVGDYHFEGRLRSATVWWIWVFIVLRLTAAWPTLNLGRPVWTRRLLLGLSTGVAAVQSLLALDMFVWGVLRSWGRFQQVPFQQTLLFSTPLAVELYAHALLAATLLFYCLLARYAALCAAIIGARRLAAVARVWVTLAWALIVLLLVVRSLIGIRMAAWSPPGTLMFSLEIALSGGPIVLMTTATLILWAFLARRAGQQYRHSREVWEARRGANEVAE